MKILDSYVCGDWHRAADGFASLIDPSTEQELAKASSAGIDFERVLAHARELGGPALRAMTFAERGQLLKAMGKALKEHRDELLELSARSNGSTTPDGSFDIDGAGGTLSYYAFVGKKLGDRKMLTDGAGVQLARSEGFWGQHVLVPRHGVAVHINAFNFPAWGFAEKAACALLAGMPVITKPATATALVAARCAEIVIEAGILPPGALQLVCGRTGNLLDLLGPQDVLAFTGSADTALKLRDRDNLRQTNTRINVEADSLNAAVLAPDLEAETFDLFVRDVAREMTQKSGQKCTAVRRILVPTEHLDTVRERLVERLDRVVTGDPAAEGVKMGPLATASQLADAERGVAELRAAGAEIVYGTGKRVDGAGADAGKGYFFGPTLLLADPSAAEAVHRREVFAPVATLLPYDGSAAEAARLVALGGGTLVTSAYGDDEAWLGAFVAGAACTTGRLYLGSQGSAGDAMGSGVALPQCLHGGPGRAGGGEELGGEVGLGIYLQRVALQGSRGQVEALAGVGD
ncbi:MAG: 3,4-dehydroadipyl-CoA semialdehyde dehydrogenase [Acidobacteriota bacterium]